MTHDHDVTALLLAWSKKDEAARRYLRHARDHHSLAPTALVHETYLKLVDQRRVRWQNRAHFFGIAAT